MSIHDCVYAQASPPRPLMATSRHCGQLPCTLPARTLADAVPWPAVSRMVAGGGGVDPVELPVPRPESMAPTILVPGIQYSVFSLVAPLAAHSGWSTAGS